MSKKVFLWGKVFLLSFLGILLISIISQLNLFSLEVKANQPIRIMIDPGHSGENLGADYHRIDGKHFVEKDMTLITALAMKEELETYDNVEVYLTRESDLVKDMTLPERVQAAKDVNADFLIALHYNMSVTHILYGSEVWVPSTGELYAKGTSLATEFMKEFDSLDLFHRGIKTRLNDKGTDYYGILRIATKEQIPSILVEHCHLDNERDFSYYDSEEKLKEFGVKDATAVAKYFGLSSSKTGADYSTYERTNIPVPTQVVAPDTSEPEVCLITLQNYDATTGDISLNIQGSDQDSDIFYYTYSVNNGRTWAPLLEWGEGLTVDTTFTLKRGTVPRIKVKIYNAYDLSCESNMIELPTFWGDSASKEDNDPLLDAIEKDNLLHNSKTTTEVKQQVITIFIVLFIAILLLVIVLFIVRIRLQKTKRNKTYRKSKKK